MIKVESWNMEIFVSHVLFEHLLKHKAHSQSIIVMRSNDTGLALEHGDVRHQRVIRALAKAQGTQPVNYCDEGEA